MSDNLWLTAREPLYIAHRGASTQLPENTTAACILAVDQGADGIEVDVQLSEDGQPVLFHDNTLARLTGNRRKVSQLTSRQLRQEQLSGGYPVAFLQELLQTLGASTLYNLELKDWGWRDRGLVDRVAQAVGRFKLERHTLISSFNPLLVRRALRRMPPPVAVALLRAPGLLQHTNRLVRTAIDNPHFSLVDAGYAAWAAQRGLRTFVWTIDDLDQARRVLDLGVHGLISNDPARLRAQLAATASAVSNA